MTKPSPSPSPETMRRVCEADLALQTTPTGSATYKRAEIERHEALVAYRAEIAPKLRTRAEVDAEIVSITREHCRRRPGDEKLPSEAIWKERCFLIIELVSEPTAPEPEPESHACNHPEACGCEEAEELRFLLGGTKRRVDELMQEQKEAEALKAKLASAEAEMRRLGYDVEPIHVFNERTGEPQFTSKTGDACWDTAENRRRTFEFIGKVNDQLRELRRQVEAANVYARQIVGCTSDLP